MKQRAPGRKGKGKPTAREVSLAAPPAATRELPPALLARPAALDGLAFATTDDLASFDGILGQPRAEAALTFGLAMERDGYNLFALGADGTGRHFSVRQYVEAAAAKRPRPQDWCYVFNFEQPNRPQVLALPAGRGGELRRELAELIEAVQAALLAAFQSEEVQTRREVVEQEFRSLQEKALEALGEEARQNGLAMVRTPMGLIFAPLAGTEVVTPEAFENLPEADKARYSQLIEQLQEKLQKVLRQAPRWQAERRAKIRQLRREVTRFTIEPLLVELRRAFADLPAVLAHLDRGAADIEHNAKAFVQEEGEEGSGGEGKPTLKRYQVNLLVDHREAAGAPVVSEDNPTYANLLGRIEQQAQMGNLVTDFTLIQAGALHRANGGYLLLDALQLLRQPYAWDGLKRALESRRLRIETLAQSLGLISTTSLEPEPMPLDLKVVLTGDRALYYLLSAYDPDFSRLFKVAADFAEDLARSPASEADYARLLARLIREEQLRPFERAAIARLLEESARLAGDGERLSLHSSAMVDLLREAELLAGSAAATVDAQHVERAIAAQIYRADRYRERWLEEVRRGTFLFDTAGAVVGQINGLAVVQLGSFAFGHPSRITARVRLGEGEVINIEREVDLSGPFHSKGVLILTGFLGERFARQRPLALAASLVFEQSYAGIEGDSASMAELCALLSAIAGIPLFQRLAMTGSVDQRGRSQPIGGVNEKIEGFFEVCRQRGLSGDQGVIIPRTNLKHLMLRREVVSAVERGAFHIYAVDDVDDCLELLSGVAAGERGADGLFPPGSFNRRVEDRLAELAELRAAQAREKRKS